MSLVRVVLKRGFAQAAVIAAVCALLANAAFSLDQRGKPGAPPKSHGGTTYHYAYWAVGSPDNGSCRKSIYSPFGCLSYIKASRVSERSYTEVDYAVGGRQDTSEVDSALADIRKAWLDGREDLIASHIDPKSDVAVLSDGKYDYSISGVDYSHMTADAVEQIRTVSFTWLATHKLTDGGFIAFGKHCGRVASGETKTVYVSYTLKKNARVCVVSEIGASTIEPSAPTVQHSTGAFTSLIVDAAGLGLERCMSPKIVRGDGSEVWGTMRVDADFVLDDGLVSYARSMDAARQSGRCGANPLVVTATSVAGTGKTDPVVTDADAGLISSENAKSKFLDKCKVIFVVDPPKSAPEQAAQPQ